MEKEDRNLIPEHVFWGKLRRKNSEEARLTRRKDDAFFKIYGFERPRKEPEGKLIVGFFRGRAKRL